MRCRLALFGLALVVCAPSLARADRVDETMAKFPLCTKSPTKDDEEAAKHAHKAALEAFDRKDYEMAARLWSDAYRFDCSRPRVFMNLGSAYEQSGDVHAALAAYKLLQERAPEEAPADLPNKIKELRVKVDASDAAEQQKAAAAAKPPEPPKAPPEMEKPLGIAPWLVVGGGGAVLVAGGVLLGVGLSQAGDAADGCTDPEARTGCTQDAVDQGESGELMSQIGQGLLYGGAGIAALGVILELAVNGERPATRDTPPSTSLRVLPLVGSDRVGLWAGGTF